MLLRKSPFYALATVSLVAVLTGCGGGGSNPASNDSIPIESEFSPNPGQIVDASGEPVTLPPSTEARTVTIVVNDAIYEDAILAPSTVAIGPTTQVAVFPANVPILDNVTIEEESRARGEVIVNGVVLPGLRMDNQGRFNRPLVLAPGQYSLLVDERMLVGPAVRPLRINGGFAFNFQVDADGQSSFPKQFSGLLPANGATTLNPKVFAAFQVDTNFGGGTAVLRVKKSNGDLEKRIDLAGTVGTFRDLAPAGGNAQIPATGVDEVIYTFLPKTN
jgi:hypothetical protein